MNITILFNKKLYSYVANIENNTYNNNYNKPYMIMINFVTFYIYSVLLQYFCRSICMNNLKNN